MSAIVVTALHGVVAFCAAGTLAWPGAWTVLAVLHASQLASTGLLARHSPHLLASRTRHAEGPLDDRLLAAVMAVIGPLTTVLVAGLEVRWSGTPGLTNRTGFVVGLFLMVGGGGLTVWSMAVNRWFFSTFRIADDHGVCNRGPYARIRHPGYLGALLYDLGAPLVLGSRWAWLPTLLTVAAILVRTRREDARLHAALDGYDAYARGVPGRLLPR